MAALKRLNPRTSRIHARRRLHPSLAALEARIVLAQYNAITVTDLIADISLANSAGGTNTITLTAPSASPYVLTAVDNTTDGPTGLPVIAAGNNLTINGSGDVIERSTDSATPAFRLFDVGAGASLSLTNLTVQNGLESGSGLSAQGGAIYCQGTLSVASVTIKNNAVKGISGATGVPGAAGQGALSFSPAAVSRSRVPPYRTIPHEAAPVATIQEVPRAARPAAQGRAVQSLRRREMLRWKATRS